MRAAQTPLGLDDCPGHAASPGNPKVCVYCGTHVDSERPDEPDEVEALRIDAQMAIARYRRAKEENHGRP